MSCCLLLTGLTGGQHEPQLLPLQVLHRPLRATRIKGPWGKKVLEQRLVLTRCIASMHARWSKHLLQGPLKDGAEQGHHLPLLRQS